MEVFNFLNGLSDRIQYETNNLSSFIDNCNIPRQIHEILMKLEMHTGGYRL